MNSTIQIFAPEAASSGAPQLTRSALDSLQGKVVGFIDNAKPNFNYLADDLGELLQQQYGVTAVIKHRKRGQVPTGDTVMQELAEQCDAIITGSGD